MRRIRQKRGLTVRELGARIGLSFTIVAELERGDRKWTEERIARFQAELRKGDR